MSGSSPTLLQQRASDPASHVWVGANAGSGKTKVLVDRVLRLLLQDIPPSHILCITFTKAAAAEMEGRLQKRTREWVQMEMPALTQSLQGLNGEVPSEDELWKARRLFAVLTDCPIGVRILTIHAFCQQLLGQFPFEAGIPPHFTLVEGQEKERMVAESKRAVLGEAYHHPESPLGMAIDRFTDTGSEFSFHDLLDAIMQQRAACDEALSSIPDLFRAAGFEVGATPETLSARYFDLDEEYRVKMRRATALVAEKGSVNDKKYTARLPLFLEAPYAHEPAHELACSLLTLAGKVPEKFPTQALVKADPAAAAELQALAKRAQQYIEDMRQLTYCLDSEAMLVLADAYFRHYQRLKTVQAALDYDDLIHLTLKLLDHPHLSPWVLYKLDGQIHHLLMDEAQDVSPVQWQLTERLVETFFDGKQRSLFVVGDEKQSIYGFQGAAPERFAEERERYQQKALYHAAPFAHIPMQTSFRSGEAIMKLVDTVFAGQEAREALSSDGQEVIHTASRKGCYGQVTLYPIIRASGEGSGEPEEGEADLSAVESLAKTVALTILGWLRSQKVLAKTGAPVTPSDILILVQQRNPLMQPLLEALGRHGIACAGVDRFMLSRHLAVRDMMALCAFLCDAGDDMALACLLTSPLYGLTYDALTSLCALRGEKTLWESLQEEEGHAFAREELAALQQMGNFATPHELFADLLLGRQGFARYLRAMGEEVQGALQSFLHACALYGQSQTISLHGFLIWMQGMTTELKREAGTGDEGVRIMTVHGAKGLEAPVVILPDTLRDVSMRQERVFSVPKRSPPLMVYLRGDKRKEKTAGIFRSAYEAKQQALARESLRLLYVALTRASDELHLFGYVGGKNPAADSWYSRVKEALRHLEAEEREDGTLRYAVHEDKAPAVSEVIKEAPFNPDNYRYLLEAIPPAPAKKRFLRPSEFHEPFFLPADVQAREGYVLNPEQHREVQRYGTVVHALLERQANRAWGDFLGDLPVLLDHLAPDMEESKRHQVEEDFAVFAAFPDLISLLEQPALAEVPIIGRNAEGAGISGRIDRLIVTERSVHIIDFKTGTTPANAQQLTAYADVIRPLYPDHRMRLSFLYFKPVPSLQSF